MMCGQLFSLLILLILCGSVYALECPVGGRCKIGKINSTVERKSKECDACVAFSCSTGSKSEAVGVGCYDDFVNVCKWVPGDVKEAILNNSNSAYKVVKSSFKFVSSKDNNESAAASYKFLSDKGHRHRLGPGRSYNFTIKFNSDPSPKPIHYQSIHRGIAKSCIYDDAPKPKLDQVNCPVREQCIPSKAIFEDNAKLNIQYPPSDNNTCSACVSFLYTDDFQRIIARTGCYEDFEQLTKFTTAIPDEDKAYLKENHNDTFLIGEKYILYSCNTGDDCAAINLPYYNDVNQEDLYPLIDKFDREFDEECRIPEEPSKGTRTATGFGLTGIAIFSLIFLLF